MPYDFDLKLLPFDEDSLDAKGITIDPWGNFWVCEEYKPSMATVGDARRFPVYDPLSKAPKRLVHTHLGVDAPQCPDGAQFAALITPAV